MKLSQWAKKNNLSYNTAYRHFKAGRIAGARQLSTGTILVDEFSDAEEKLRKIKEILDGIK